MLFHYFACDSENYKIGSIESDDENCLLDITTDSGIKEIKVVTKTVNLKELVNNDAIKCKTSAESEVMRIMAENSSQYIGISPQEAIGKLVKVN